MIVDALKRATALLLPTRCAACESSGTETLLCLGCAGSLVPGDEGSCPRCGGMDLEGAPGPLVGPCGACLASAPPYGKARGAFAYGGALADAISRWKNLPDPTLSRPLCRLFLTADWTGWIDPIPKTIVFVPPDPGRFRRRGFHPAGLLARTLSARLQVPLDPRALEVRRAYPSSQGQSPRGRRERLRGVFRGRAASLASASILLVDDVMTTGATVTAATQACLRAGARDVTVAVLARAPR